MTDSQAKPTGGSKRIFAFAIALSCFSTFAVSFFFKWFLDGGLSGGAVALVGTLFFLIWFAILFLISYFRRTR
jgi:hypothetical protein